MAGTLAVLCLVMYAGDAPYVTEDDLTFYWACVAYVAAYAAYHGLFAYLALVTRSNFTLWPRPDPARRWTRRRCPTRRRST